MLSYADVAAVLGVQKSTLYAWVSCRQIPFVRLGKRLVRFKREAIEQWVSARSTEVQS